MSRYAPKSLERSQRLNNRGGAGRPRPHDAITKTSARKTATNLIVTYRTPPRCYLFPQVFIHHSWYRSVRRATIDYDYDPERPTSSPIPNVSVVSRDSQTDACGSLHAVDGLLDSLLELANPSPILSHFRPAAPGIGLSNGWPPADTGFRREPRATITRRGGRCRWRPWRRSPGTPQPNGQPGSTAAVS